MHETLEIFDVPSGESASHAEIRQSSGRLLTIGELSSATGATPAAIRFYEEQGLISPRRLGRLRVYSVADAGRLKSVLRYRKMGLPVAEIASALRIAQSSTPDEHLRLETGLLRAHLHVLEARLEGLQSEIDCTESALAGVLTSPPASCSSPN